MTSTSPHQYSDLPHHDVTVASRRRAADVIVHVAPGAGDGTVPDTAGNLIGRPVCSRAAREVAVLVHNDHSDGVVVIFRNLQPCGVEPRVLPSARLTRVHRLRYVHVEQLLHP